MLALGCDAGEGARASRHSDPLEEARYAKEVADQDALRAEERLNAALRDLDRLDRDISEAVTDVADAMTQAQREEAAARLRSLQQVQAELRSRAKAARAAAEKARRNSGAAESSECASNPLATGCP